MLKISTHEAAREKTNQIAYFHFKREKDKKSPYVHYARHWNKVHGK